MQADELVHENDLPKIKEAMTKYADDLEVEGLLLKYYQFWGSYDFCRTDRIWPEGAVRVVRNGINVYSANDAQSFYIANRRRMYRLKVADIGGHIYHYGWVRNPEMMKKKNSSVDKYFNKSQKPSKIEIKDFDYHNVNPKYLMPFNSSHPKVMEERINKCNWDFGPSACHYKPTLKTLRYELKSLIERAVGRRVFPPHHYKRIK